MGCGNRVLVYETLEMDFCVHKPLSRKVAEFKHPQPRDASQENATDEYPSPYNALKTGFIGMEEVLVGVDDAGQVVVWFIGAMHYSSYGDVHEPVSLVLENDNSSTWAIAMNKKRKLLATGANNHKVSVWDFNSADVVSSKYDLEGHTHNVPCVDFHPDGEYLASCSIDETVKIWHLETRQCVFTHQVSSTDPRFGNDRWCWNVKFCNVDDISYRTMNTEEELRLKQDLPARNNRNLLFNAFNILSNNVEQLMDRIIETQNDDDMEATDRETMIQALYEEPDSQGSDEDEQLLGAQTMLDLLHRDLRRRRNTGLDDDVIFGEEQEQSTASEESASQPDEAFRQAPRYFPPPTYEDSLENLRRLNNNEEVDFASDNDSDSFVSALEYFPDSFNVINSELKKNYMFLICTTRTEVHFVDVNQKKSRSCILNLLDQSRNMDRSESGYAYNYVYDDSAAALAAESRDENSRMRRVLDDQHGRLVFVEAFSDDTTWTGAFVVANQSGQCYLINVEKFKSNQTGNADDRFFYHLDLEDRIPFVRPLVSVLVGMAVSYCKGIDPTLDVWKIRLVYSSGDISMYEVKRRTISDFLKY